MCLSVLCADFRLCLALEVVLKDFLLCSWWQQGESSSKFSVIQDNGLPADGKRVFFTRLRFFEILGCGAEWDKLLIHQIFKGKLLFLLFPQM